jgi:hypothetical protein
VSAVPGLDCPLAAGCTLRLMQVEQYAACELQIADVRGFGGPGVLDCHFHSRKLRYVVFEERLQQLKSLDRIRWDDEHSVLALPTLSNFIEPAQVVDHMSAGSS